MYQEILLYSPKQRTIIAEETYHKVTLVTTSGIASSLYNSALCCKITSEKANSPEQTSQGIQSQSKG